DSSALVKRYVQETGTAWVRGITRRNPSTVIYIAHITAVEVTCAVARRRKGKTLTPPRASSILRRFRQHLAARYTVFEVAPGIADDATLSCKFFTMSAPQRSVQENSVQSEQESRSDTRCTRHIR